MQLININRIKIITSLIGAFVVVLLLSHSVFYANSPTINPLFIAGLKNIPNTVVSFPTKMLASLPVIQKPVMDSNSRNLAGRENNMQNNYVQDNIIPTAIPTQIPVQMVSPTITSTIFAYRQSPSPTTPQTIPTSVPAGFKIISKGVYAQTDPLTKVQTVTITSGIKIEVRDYEVTLANGTISKFQLLIPVAE